MFVFEYIITQKAANIRKYRIPHTGAKISFGGVRNGLFKLLYQVKFIFVF